MFLYFCIIKNNKTSTITTVTAQLSNLVTFFYKITIETSRITTTTKIYVYLFLYKGTTETSMTTTTTTTTTTTGKNVS
jgi:hypothetical protein